MLNSSSPLSLLVLDDATIRRNLTIEDVIHLVELAFSSDALGHITTLPVVSCELAERKSGFAIKSSHLHLPSSPSGMSVGEALGLKAGTYWPSNSGRGISNHNAVVMLIDPDTGRPSALMAANTITTLRTAAAGAIAARHLARRDAANVAVLGAGDQGYAQLHALLAVRKVKEVRIWTRRVASAAEYAAFWEAKGISTNAYDSVQETVRDADIIITTTPSRKPLVKSAWVAAGTHINAIGSDAPGKQELEAELVARGILIADKRTQSLSIGEMQEPILRGLVKESHIRAELGQICAGLAPGRTDEDSITIFDSSGVSFQDLIVAQYLYEHATKNGLGQYITL